VTEETIDVSSQAWFTYHDSCCQRSGDIVLRWCIWTMCIK